MWLPSDRLLERCAGRYGPVEKTAALLPAPRQPSPCAGSDPRLGRRQRPGHRVFHRGCRCTLRTTDDPAEALHGHGQRQCCEGPAVAARGAAGARRAGPLLGLPPAPGRPAVRAGRTLVLPLRSAGPRHAERHHVEARRGGPAGRGPPPGGAPGRARGAPPGPWFWRRPHHGGHPAPAALGRRPGLDETAAAPLGLPDGHAELRFHPQGRGAAALAAGAGRGS
mmetsp:Transcript_24182/g.75970  ORF Transcript_24182/g.75970 Transcript_24182/m.75970 type:complete len:223 (-) Transcript_24182:534-1202(-)